VAAHLLGTQGTGLFDQMLTYALSVLYVRVAEELSLFCPRTGFPTLPWTPRWWSRRSIPGPRTPIFPASERSASLLNDWLGGLLGLFFAIDDLKGQFYGLARLVDLHLNSQLDGSQHYDR